jgi:hypothetical protein
VTGTGKARKKMPGDNGSVRGKSIGDSAGDKTGDKKETAQGQAASLFKSINAMIDIGQGIVNLLQEMSPAPPTTPVMAYGLSASLFSEGARPTTEAGLEVFAPLDALAKKHGVAPVAMAVASWVAFSCLSPYALEVMDTPEYKKLAGEAEKVKKTVMETKTRAE